MTSSEKQTHPPTQLGKGGAHQWPREAVREARKRKEKAVHGPRGESQGEEGDWLAQE